MEAVKPASGVSFAPLLKRDAKELVVNILSEHWPLTAKQIHQAVVKDYQPDLTYQAVHKTLRQLQQERVVESNGREYALREGWIKGLHAFTERLLATRAGASESLLQELNRSGSVNLRFDRMIDFGSWVVKFHSRLVRMGAVGGTPQVFHFKHVWPAHVMVGDDYLNLLRMFTKPVYALVRDKSPMERALANIPQKLGAKIKLGTNVASTCDTVAAGDYVYNVYFSREDKLTWDRICAESKKASRVDLKELYDLMHKPSVIRVVLTKSPEVAGQLREETLAQLKR